jgi:hypothetical protein
MSFRAWERGSGTKVAVFAPCRALASNDEGSNLTEDSEELNTFAHLDVIKNALITMRSGGSYGRDGPTAGK